MTSVTGSPGKSWIRSRKVRKFFLNGKNGDARSTAVSGKFVTFILCQCDTPKGCIPSNCYSMNMGNPLLTHRWAKVRCCSFGNYTFAVRIVRLPRIFSIAFLLFLFTTSCNKSGDALPGSNIPIVDSVPPNGDVLLSKVYIDDHISKIFLYNVNNRIKTIQLKPLKRTRVLN